MSAANKMTEALKLREGALLQTGKCADNNCQGPQNDFLDAAVRAVRASFAEHEAEKTTAQQAQGVPAQKESHAELDLHSNPARDEQQRQLASALEVGQPLGFGQDESASNSQPKGAIARISGMDEYGPMLEWYTHWTNFKIGTEIYAAAPQAEPALDKTRDHLSTMIVLVLDARQRGAAYEAGSAIDKAVQEAIGHLKNWPQAPAVEAEPQPEREPLTDEQWLKRWTAVSGQQLKPGLQRMSLLSTLRFAERVYGIGTKGGKP